MLCVHHGYFCCCRSILDVSRVSGYALCCFCVSLGLNNAIEFAVSLDLCSSPW